MARNPSPHPTELEFEILKILWSRGPSTVREVREELADFRELAHTSVMTTMTIMTKKGYLARKKEGMGYVYRAKIEESSTKRKMVSDMVDRAFEGSASALLLNLLEKEKISGDELDALRKLIDQKSREERQ